MVRKRGILIVLSIITIIALCTLIKSQFLGGNESHFHNSTLTNASQGKSEPNARAQSSPPPFDPQDPAYLLRTRGYPREVSLAQAVEEFNQRARENRIGQTQPQLTVDEVIAAIRDWNVKDEPINIKVYAIFQNIAQTAMMPKGSYLFFSTGTGAYRGYDIDAWHIYIRVGLDKYPDDLVGVPAYSRLIRTQYITSRPASNPK